MGEHDYHSWAFYGGGVPFYRKLTGPDWSESNHCEYLSNWFIDPLEGPSNCLPARFKEGVIRYMISEG